MLRARRTRRLDGCVLRVREFGVVGVVVGVIGVAVREPPISGEPSIRLTVPSEFTLAMALDGPVPLNQKPPAMPRP